MNDVPPQQPPNMEEVRKLPPDQRIPMLGDIRLVFPLWKDILDAMAQCHEDRSNPPEPECLLLVGPTGAGKSTLARSYAQRFPRNRNGHHIQQPVLMITIFPAPTEKTLAMNVLAALGDPCATSGTGGAMTQRSVKLLCDSQTKLLIFDEIQHFVDQDNNKLLYTASDWLKTIIKETRTACVLVGLQGRAEGIVYQNEQLAGLFGDPWVLPAFIWERPDTQKQSDFQMLLFQLESLLPFNEPSKLYDLNLAWRCYVACGGSLRYLMRLIRRASTLALEGEQECLDQALLATAFKQSLRRSRSSIENPFDHDPPAEYIIPSPPEPGMPGGTSKRGQTPPPQQVRLKDVFP